MSRGCENVVGKRLDSTKTMKGSIDVQLDKISLRRAVMPPRDLFKSRIFTNGILEARFNSAIPYYYKQKLILLLLLFMINIFIIIT